MTLSILLKGVNNVSSRRSRYTKKSFVSSVVYKITLKNLDNLLKVRLQKYAHKKVDSVVYRINCIKNSYKHIDAINNSIWKLKKSSLLSFLRLLWFLKYCFFFSLLCTVCHHLSGNLQATLIIHFLHSSCFLGCASKLP